MSILHIRVRLESTFSPLITSTGEYVRKRLSCQSRGISPSQSYAVKGVYSVSYPPSRLQSTLRGRKSWLSISIIPRPLSKFHFRGPRPRLYVHLEVYLLPLVNLDQSSICASHVNMWWLRLCTRRGQYTCISSRISRH